MLDEHPVVNELLHRRGIADVAAARAFLDDAPSRTPDPWRLPNLDAAIARIQKAVARRERIAIFGDYDVDGISSTALLARSLRNALDDSSHLLARLPIRAEGYGLNNAAIDWFAEQGVTLLITVDCGTSDHEQVAHAIGRGLDVIAIDHHHMRDAGPEGAIIVSPQLGDDAAYKALTGVGVTFLVAAALEAEGLAVGEVRELLDLVALGTIADVAQVAGINRGLIRDGLRAMSRFPKPGLLAILRKAGLDPAAVTSDRIAFKVTPRLNAAGRIADPHVALNLLMEDDVLLAARLADRIDALNEERKIVSLRTARAAEALILADPGWEERAFLVAHAAGWPPGVVGIVASQLADRYGRPVAVLAEHDGIAKGSLRSVPGFNIVEALGRNEALLQEWGGHEQAAGVTLPVGEIPAFEAAIDREVRETGLPIPAPPRVRIDAEIAPAFLTLDTAKSLSRLQPFGPGNEQPQFLLRNIKRRSYETIGSDGTHLRVVFDVPGGQLRAICFGAASRSKELLLADRLDIVAQLSLDVWNGRQRLDLEIKDFRPAR
jgi:single-stranded-DNA-specific exonuclease